MSERPFTLSKTPSPNGGDIPINVELGDYEDGHTGSEIAMCVLSAVNLGKLKKLSDLEQTCTNIVRSLDNVIEYQEYPVKAASKMLKRRSIGVGVTNLAYWLAKQKVGYDMNGAIVVDELFEHLQFYLLKASMNLAKERGQCEWFSHTTYADGLMPQDKWTKGQKALVERPTSDLDWSQLRKDIVEHGLRNSVLSCQFPAESSSVVTNSTNGIEPPRDFVSEKLSKQGIIKMVVPESKKLMAHYTLAWEMPDNKGMNLILGVIQKWLDQSISSNHYYNPQHPMRGEEQAIPLSEVAQDIFQAYANGVDNLYYANTNDGNTDSDSGCDSGACSV